MRIKAVVGAYSSIVGAGVLINDYKGHMIGQIAILCHTDPLRDKAAHIALCDAIAKALDGFDLPIPETK